jgi:hypothetical protein
MIGERSSYGPWRRSISIIALAMMIISAACTRHEMSPDDQIAPHTGDPAIEAQVGDLTAPASQATSTEPTTPPSTPPSTPMRPVARQGQTAYVSADRLRVRTSPEVNASNIAGVLEINDQVEITNAQPQGQAGFVEIRVIQTRGTAPKGQKLYTSLQHLSSQRVQVDPAATTSIPAAPGAPAQASAQPAAPANRLFVITNVATEKLRVYQRCLPTEGCVNRMLAEFDVVNGQDDDGTRTDVGHYRITSWEKFYESPAHIYPAWYKPGYPPVPAPGNRRAWFESAYMPNGVGKMRGAFGWYTAKIGPNPNGQWTHGTGGWGADKKSFIDFKDSFWGGIVGLFTSIRSKGCTRVDNESIAYLRSLLPVGTPLIKIYAKEGYRDANRSGYSRQPTSWSYILTTVGHQRTNNHQLADRQTVLSQGTPRSQWIEEGTLAVDQYPDAVAFSGGKRGGDLYDLGERAFRGHFIVDEGTVMNYSHPSSISRGGFSDGQLPSFAVSSNSQISVPRATYSHSTSNPHDQWSGGGN